MQCIPFSRTFFYLRMFSVSFWCSIRVAVAFVGFLGMVAHYAQKISVGIALVCMVNHTAISPHKDSIATPLTQADIDCPRATDALEIVRKKCSLLIFQCFLLVGRAVFMDEKYSRYCFRWIFLGLFDNRNSWWIFGCSIWSSIYLWYCNDYFRYCYCSHAMGCKFTLWSTLVFSINCWTCPWCYMAKYDCYYGTLGTT